MAQQQRADESKVAALESIFGGQDITASVIRTVLSSNENKFDEAVDSLLNMSTNNDNKPQPARPAARVEETEDALRDRREREKLKTLENMFGGDLSQSVICTVLESNKGELVDAVDTLLNMTSKEINPNYADVSQRDIERARQEEEMKNYEEFKRLQIALQEEEARAVKEEQQKRAEDLRRNAEAAAVEERKRKESVLEQERRFKEYEAQKKAQTELAAQEQARRREAEQRMAEDARKQAESRRERELEEAQEKLHRAWEEKLKLLNAEEEKVRKLQEAQQAEEETRRQELLAREQACAVQEQRLQQAKQAEEARLAERKAMLAAEKAAKAEEKSRQLRVEAEARVFKQRLEEEERTRFRRAQEERREEEYKQRLDAERLELQREKARLEALRLAEEERLRREEEERLHNEKQLRVKLQEEQRRMAIELEQQQREKEDAALRLLDEERRLEEEEERQELLRAEQEKEAQRLHEEEQRNQALKEEAEKQQATFEEERRKKSVFDQIAASAVFIPPKAEATADQITISARVAGDTVVADWDLPEGNASATNWLGLYPIRALPNTNKYVQFVYTNGAHSGQHTFRGVTPGHYEVRFFATRLYQHTASSRTVRVGPSPTLSAQLQGDQLLVYYTLDPMSATPTREWLGIYEKTQRRNKIYLSSAYGNAEGNVMLKAPRNPGVYEVRLFATGSVYNEQVKCEFVVEDNDCINIDSPTVMAGANVNVTWVVRTVEPSSGDWIGLYKAEEANNGHYLSSTYTNGISVGAVTIAAPKEAGVYELRLFARAKGRYVTFRTSAPLTVV